MTSINQYATRTFAEHPAALWPLDDDMAFISLVADSVRDLSNVTAGHWTHDGTVSVVGAQGAPFAAASVYRVSKSGLTLTSTSPHLFSPTIMGSASTGFHVGAYVRFNNQVVNYTLSAFYDDSTATIVSETFTGGPVGTWVLIGKTFVPPGGFSNVQFMLQVTFLDTASSSYSYDLNGLSVGQMSEQTCADSLGVVPVAIGSGIPAALGRVSITGTPVIEYGIGSNNGYALIQANNLLAANYGIPLVYGSDSSTHLRASADESGLPKLPSLILPGMGMLNNEGKHNVYTFEAWLRVQVKASTSRRIFGPVGSTDGLYVKDGFLSLVVGDQIASHGVSTWYRPMLVHIIMQKNSIALMVNGELVGSIVAGLSDYPVGSDWLGFYAYVDTVPFELDSVSIFPYAIDSAVARHKFVWGQGVEFPELSNSAYGGTPMAIDYAYSKMNSNFSYPDYARFDAGYVDNMLLANATLAAPNYNLPLIVTGSKTTKQLFADSFASWAATGPTSITFRHDSTWTDPCYLKWDSLSVLSSPVSGVIAIFNSPTMTGVQPLVHFVDKVSGSRFQIDLDNTSGTKVTYKMVAGTVTRLLQSTSVSFDTDFTVGINFQTLLADGGLAAFFNNRNNIQVFVGGNEVDTFAGKIHRVSFMSVTDMLTYAPDFTPKGFANATGIGWTDVMAYTLLPISEYSNYFLDIAVSGSWEEHYPLEYYSTFTSDPFGNTKYDVDFLQFNIGAVGSVTPYVTFQKISGGANKPLSDFPTKVALPSNSIIDARTATGISKKAFEVSNNSIIYPPKSLPIEDTAIVLHLDFEIVGIKSNPFVLRNMSLISKSLDYDKFNEVGTKFGLPMYPYSKYGQYYAPKPENPFVVYKGSTPHLYLTEDSGIRVVKVGTVESGINIPVNASKQQAYQMSAAQIWIKFSDDLPVSATTLFSIESSVQDIDFQVVAEDGRAKVSAVDRSTASAYVGLSYYQDGKPVVSPYLEKDVWTAIGIDLVPSLEFSDVGSINLLPGAYFNNVVFYHASALQRDYLNAYRYWEQVRHNVVDGTDLYWSDWNSGTWDKVWKLSSNALSISIDKIFETYVGTNRVVVDDGSGVTFSTFNVVALASESYISGGSVVVANAPSWHSIVRKPV